MARSGFTSILRSQSWRKARLPTISGVSSLSAPPPALTSTARRGNAAKSQKRWEDIYKVKSGLKSLLWQNATPCRSRAMLMAMLNRRIDKWSHMRHGFECYGQTHMNEKIPMSR
ncbi:MAG: hypothetical protein EA339_10990 [Rhodobacteraceae bacterium]|nr:MAG: hypothetical protein EA339_10990 [Paracoccaceae bacterium]